MMQRLRRVVCAPTDRDVSHAAAAAETSPSDQPRARERPACPGTVRMRKERIVKEDGRYLYYFWFDDRAETR